MKQIFVGKDLAYAAKVGGSTISGINELTSLDTGAIAIFTDKNVLVTNANKGTVLDDCKSFYIAVGDQRTPGSKSFLSELIPRTGTSFKKTEYSPAVQLVKYIGNDGTQGALNNPTITGVDQELSIKIIDTTPGLRTMGAVDKQEIYRYSIKVKTGDTINTLITALIAKINADTNRIVDALVVGSQVGVKLTAIGVGTTFAIAVDGILVNATIEQPEGTTAALIGNSIAMTFGEGTAAQITAMEDAFSVERGNTSRLYLSNLYYSNQSLVTSGSVYDQYSIWWNGRKNMSLGSQDTYRFDVTVALIDDSTPKATFEAIMIEMFAGLVNTSPAEMGS